MLAHVAVNVTDFEIARSFYLGALQPLGYRVVYEEPGAPRTSPTRMTSTSGSGCGTPLAVPTSPSRR